MKKLMFVLPLLLVTQVSWAQGRDGLCRLWYSNDMFKTYLRLYVETPGTTNKNYVLWMDRHIPYGIRPYPYVVSKILCDTKTSLQVAAQAPGTEENVEFKFDASNSTQEWQPGTLTYLDKDGKAKGTTTLECSLPAIKNFCENLGH